jgi:AraC-like DNA-binding protein
MTYDPTLFEKLKDLVIRYSPEEGINLSSIEFFGTFKSTETHSRKPSIDVPAIFIVLQGRKLCYVGEKVYDYCPGNALVMFYPMAVEVEFVRASPDTPFLATGVAIDLSRMADVLLRIDRIEGAVSKPDAIDPSGVFSIQLNDHLIDPFIRLFDSLENPRDAGILGDAIIDEIYYRILTDEHGANLRFLLQQRGEIQRVSKAVEYIHQNIDQPVSVEGLADMVHMSRTTFYENFKEVMHLSPLQYAKSVKLDHAQSLIKEGRKANEAGYLVGYNSPAQFSREYKRHFGFSPSAT